MNSNPSGTWSWYLYSLSDSLISFVLRVYSVSMTITISRKNENITQKSCELKSIFPNV